MSVEVLFVSAKSENVLAFKMLFPNTHETWEGKCVGIDLGY
jgi:hypothetical protein